MQTFLSITSLKSISTFKKKKMIRRLCLTSQRQTLLATMCQRRTSLRPMIHGSRFATSLRRASRQTSSLAIGTLREISLCCAALASHMLSASLTVRSLFRQCHSGTNTLSQISSLHTPGCAIDQFAVGPPRSSHALLQDFSYLHIEIDDTANEPISTYFPRSNQFISEAIQKGGKVLVHWYVLRGLYSVLTPRSAAGISRSATVRPSVRLLLTLTNSDV